MSMIPSGSTSAKTIPLSNTQRHSQIKLDFPSGAVRKTTTQETFASDPIELPPKRIR